MADLESFVAEIRHHLNHNVGSPPPPDVPSPQRLIQCIQAIAACAESEAPEHIDAIPAEQIVADLRLEWYVERWSGLGVSLADYEWSVEEDRLRISKKT